MKPFLLGQHLASVNDPESPTEEPTEDVPLEETPLGEGVEQAVTVTFDIVGIVAATLIGAAIGLLVAVLLIAIAQMVARRHPVIEPALEPTRRPFQLTLLLAGAWIAFGINTTSSAAETEPGWRQPLFHGGLILIILAGTWFVASLVVGFEAAVVRHVDRTATRRAKRIQTQFQIVRRVLVALVWTLGVAGILITFPTARTAGASLLASAGIISVIAGLAAQSALSNVFAGLQVAFSDSLRVDDVVIINGEYCAVEEITLTYVVVKVWDGRRLIVPSSILTTETFENWTRRDSDIMGKIYFDLDWQVPVEAMRSEMHRCLRATDLWDGSIGILQVDSAENGSVRIAILVSAADSAALTDLRYYVREHMVRWIQKEVPMALPYSRRLYASYEDWQAAVDQYPDPQEFIEEEVKPSKPRAPRTELDLADTVVLPTDYLPYRRSLAQRPPRELPEEELSPSPATTGVSTTGVKPGHESSIFSGSPEAEERAKDFSGPGEEVIAERERTAAERLAVHDDEEPDDVEEAASSDTEENR